VFGTYSSDKIKEKIAYYNEAALLLNADKN